MTEVYTALLIILAVHNGGIEKTREVPFPSLKQCQEELAKFTAEADPKGYTFVAKCIEAGGQET